MIGTILAAIVGKRIDESDGEGGAAGAVLGVLGFFVAKRLVPVALFGGAVLVARHYLSRATRDS